MFRAVKPRLAEDLAAAGSVVQRAGQKAITDSEAFWLAQKEEFLKTVSGETNDLLQQGIQQGSQLGLSLNFDLVNQEVLRFSAVYQDAWWNQLASTTRNGLRDALQANIASGAGHDAAFVARIAPSAMLFIPCRDGKSHAPEEWAEPDALAAGTAVIAEAVLRFDRGSSTG